MNRTEIIKQFIKDDRFIEWENKWKNDELFLDTIINSEFTKEIINKNLKVVLWFKNHNCTFSIQSDEQGRHICEIKFLKSDYDIFADSFKDGKISKCDIIDYDVTE